MATNETETQDPVDAAPSAEPTDTVTEAAPAETPDSDAAADLPAAAVLEDDETRNARKVRDGIVVSDKMDKTVVVVVERRVKHPKYHKFVTKSTRYHAHDETNDAAVGDLVRIVETRPLSKTKRFRLETVLERAE